MSNEVRVKTQGKHFRYASYAGKLIFENNKEVFVHGTGKAIPKIIQIIEYLRKRIKGLHVGYQIVQTKFEDTYEPLEEGLDKVTLFKFVPTLKATVSFEIDRVKNF